MGDYEYETDSGCLSVRVHLRHSIYSILYTTFKIMYSSLCLKKCKFPFLFSPLVTIPEMRDSKLSIVS